MKRCKNCEFFLKVGEVLGECRRFPPRPDGKGTHTVDEFPAVLFEYWCGEYKKGAKK